MELNFLIFFLVPLFIFFFSNPFIKLCKTIAKISIKPPTRLPPGPWKLPFIGNLHQMATGLLPHRNLMALSKKHGPIFHLQLGENSTIIISSAKLAEEALKMNDISLASRPEILVGKIIFYNHANVGLSPYGNHWRQMRKIETLNILSAAKVRSFQSLREEEISSFIESIRTSSGSKINLSKKIYALQSGLICRAIIGYGSKCQDELIDLAIETTKAAGGFDVADLFPSFKLLHFLFGSASKLEKMHQKIDQILDNIINEHRGKTGASSAEKEDLLDVLLRLKESNALEFPITVDYIKAIIMEMFVAGTDTSATVIEWAMAEMMKKQRVMEKAQAELRQVLKGKNEVNEADIQGLTYLNLVIKETLRLHCPAPLLLPRKCREQCEIGGYTIPVNTHLIINAWSIARDPAYWQDPESFEPERFENASLQFSGTNFEYIPFGAGRRMCPGLLFGLASVELSLAQLLYHFDWSLPDGMKAEDIDMSEVFGATVGMKNHLSCGNTIFSTLINYGIVCLDIYCCFSENLVG